MARERREARLARRLEKQLRQNQKSARLRERPIDAAIRALDTLVGKHVRTGADPGSIIQMIMAWTINTADREGRWTWGVTREWSEDAWGNVIAPKLAQFERLRWWEIEAMRTGGRERHRMHHLMECGAICQESQDRLAHLGHDHEEIYRFRLGNRRRLWGFRIVNVFEILWYDPTHQIYPTDPD